MEPITFAAWLDETDQRLTIRNAYTLAYEYATVTGHPTPEQFAVDIADDIASALA